MNTNAFTQVDELLCMIDVADSNAGLKQKHNEKLSVRLNCLKEVGVVNKNNNSNISHETVSYGLS